MAAKNKHKNRSAAPRVRPKEPRPGAAYALPAAGSLQPWLDDHLDALQRAGTAESRRFRASAAGLLHDLAGMLERAEQDLAQFTREGTPVTARHFELLQLFKRELDAVAADALLARTGTEVVGADLQQAMAAAVRARDHLANRAAACDVAVEVLELREVKNSPWAFQARANLVLAAAEPLLERLDNPRRGRELWAELDAAVKALGALLLDRLGVQQSRDDAAQRRRLLLSALYPYMLWLSQWGRAVFAGDPAGLRRWCLDKGMHRHRRRAGSPAPAPAPAPDVPE